MFPSGLQILFKFIPLKVGKCQQQIFSLKNTGLPLPMKVFEVFQPRKKWQFVAKRKKHASETPCKFTWIRNSTGPTWIHLWLAVLRVLVSERGRQSPLCHPPKSSDVQHRGSEQWDKWLLRLTLSFWHFHHKINTPGFNTLQAWIQGLKHKSWNFDLSRPNFGNC